MTSIVGIARRKPTQAFPKVEWCSADVVSDNIATLFGGLDAVMHLTWIVQPNHRESDLWAVNVGGTRRVHEAMAAAEVPILVHESAFGAYQAAPVIARSTSRGPPTAFPPRGTPGRRRR